MAKGANLLIDVIADASQAVGELDKTTGAVKSYGDAASTAAKQSRDISGGIEGAGDSAANVTTGLRDLGGAMAGMGGTVGAMGTAMVGASTAFEAMDGAATLYKGAQQAATMAAGGFSKAMQFMKITILTNPIFIIAAIIIGIAVALVIAYKKSETFRAIVDGAFRAVLGAIRAVWNWVKSNWPMLLAILTGPIGLAVLAIARNWGTIKTAVSGVISFFRTTWAALLGILTAPFNSAWSVISGVFDKITGAIDTVVGWIQKIKFPSPPSWFSAVMPGSFSAAPPVAGVARGAPAARAGGSSGGGVTINVSGALDPEGVARQVRRILAASDTRGGRLGVLRPVGTV